MMLLEWRTLAGADIPLGTHILAKRFDARLRTYRRVFDVLWQGPDQIPTGWPRQLKLPTHYMPMPADPV